MNSVMKLKYIFLFTSYIFISLILTQTHTSLIRKNTEGENLRNNLGNNQVQLLPNNMMYSNPIEMQTATIGNEMLPMQQPILLSGGQLPPLNVYHSPVWVNSNKAVDGLNPNDPSQLQTLQRLNQLNKELDQELNKIKPILSQNIVISSQNFPKFQQVEQQQPNFMKNNNNNIVSTYDINRMNIANNMNQNQDMEIPSYNQPEQQFPKINGYDSRFKEASFDFTGATKSSSPLCIRREGMLKIRDVDQKDKDVVVTYAVLTKDRLSYFVNAKDESSIQGSIELAKIKESLKLINGFPTCFTIKTLDGVSDCSICAESEDSAREWINAVTQNAVNCNTMSALNNLNKRGLLK